MLKSQYEYTPIYNHIYRRFEVHQQSLQKVNDFEKQKLLLINSLNRLGNKIIIPTSQLDDSIRAVVKDALGNTPKESALGLVVDIDHLEQISDELYRLTVYGRIEDTLRDLIVSRLRNYLVEASVKNEAKYEQQLAEAWQAYYEEMSNFEEGDYGYDGPVYPEQPRNLPFNKGFNDDELDDPAFILKTVDVPKGLLGDMLHEDFFECNFIEDIIKNCDFQKLDKNLIAHLLKTKDFFFPDTDILQRGFLLNILIDNVKHDFLKDRFSLSIHYLTCTLLDAMEKDDQLRLLIKAYNEAASKNDSRSLQKIWFYLAQFIPIVVRATSGNALDLDILDSIKQVYSVDLKKYHDTTEAMIKVFPSDDTTTIYYPGITEQKSIQPDYDGSYYPSACVKLPLRPYFHALEVIARGSHDALKRTTTSNSTAKTNVVSAMLSFVVSLTPHNEICRTGAPGKRIFINVPVDFDYKKTVLSFDLGDEVFKSKNEIEGTIGDDLQRGYAVAGRNTTVEVNEADDAKEKIFMLLDTLALANKAQFKEAIMQADIQSGVKLGYLLSSDIAKSTEHKHSERVLLRALKEASNVHKIIEAIKKALKEDHRVTSGCYTVHSGVILLYSYPNSICDKCSISLLSVQNSFEAGFIKQFVQQVNGASDEALSLRTRGYNVSQGTQDPSEFNITVVAASSKTFSKDAFARLVDARPEAKMSCRTSPRFFSDNGINLRYKAPKNDRLYEYTAGSKIHESETTASYKGKLFMSGDKSNKISSAKKRQEFEKDVTQVISKHNKGLGI